MRAGRDRGAHDGVGIFAIGLKRTCRVHNQIGGQPRKGTGHIAPVQHKWLKGRRPGDARAKLLCLRSVPTGHQNFQPRHIAQQIHQTPAKHAVTAQNQNSHFALSPFDIDRDQPIAAKDGGNVTFHITCR